MLTYRTTKFKILEYDDYEKKFMCKFTTSNVEDQIRDNLKVGDKFEVFDTENCKRFFVEISSITYEFSLNSIRGLCALLVRE